MFLSNPFKFPTLADVQKGIAHVLWLCRKEGLEFFRGPPPALRLIETGIALEANVFEAEFSKVLLEKLKVANKTKKIDLNSQNFPVRPLVSSTPHGRQNGFPCVPSTLASVLRLLIHRKCHRTCGARSGSKPAFGTCGWWPTTSKCFIPSSSFSPISRVWFSVTTNWKSCPKRFICSPSLPHSYLRAISSSDCRPTFIHSPT